MKNKSYLFAFLLLLGVGARLCAQEERITDPVIDYTRTPQQYIIGDITVEFFE